MIVSSMQVDTERILAILAGRVVSSSTLPVARIIAPSIAIKRLAVIMKKVGQLSPYNDWRCKMSGSKREVSSAKEERYALTFSEVNSAAA